ncbi:MAG: putative membrane protein YfcA [Gammaproteobacteria bacterium]|jgi:uncharacterized membrane protein YfcA
MNLVEPPLLAAWYDVRSTSRNLRDLIMPVDTLGLLLCLIISFVAASIHGVIGFGFNFIGAPILLLLYPQLVPAPIIMNSVVIVCLVGWTTRKDIQYHALGWAVGACALGAFLAGYTMAMVSASTYSALFGSLLLLAVGVSLLGWRPTITPSTAALGGGISGFMGTITSIGGPPIALLYQGLPGPALRGTLSAYFLLTTPFILAALYSAGCLGWNEVKLSVVLLPGMLLGFACSKYLARYLNAQATRAIVLLISTAGGIVLVTRAW